MNIDDLFIAPTEARQFHIQRSHLGTQNEGCWVMPANMSKPVGDDVRLPGCECSEWYVVIHHFNPTMEAARAKLEASGMFLYVCMCFGRWLE